MTKPHLSLVEEGAEPAVPRTFLFAGKAAPGYRVAKQIIKLLHGVGQVINTDPKVKGRLKVVFIPDYRVSLAEKTIPAADLSEQISTAGKEASGTSNMKFAMNGALTMGTLDGANIEIQEEVGAENIFLFGLTAAEIADQQRHSAYDPRSCDCHDHCTQRVLDALCADRFCPREPGLFAWVYAALVEQGDVYFHLADLPAYVAAQAQASAVFRHPTDWTRKAILNVARTGKFSSDRTIQEYARDIWHIQPDSLVSEAI